MIRLHSVNIATNIKVAGSVLSGRHHKPVRLKRYYIPGYFILDEGVTKTEGKSSQPCLAKSLTKIPIKDVSVDKKQLKRCPLLRTDCFAIGRNFTFCLLLSDNCT